MSTKYNKKVKFALYLLCSLAVAYSVFTVIRILTSFHLQDFSVYYQGAQDLLNQKNPYTNLNAGNVIYPPFSLVLLSPLGLLSYGFAEKVWTLTSFVLIIATIFILFKSIKRKASLTLFFVVYSLFMLSFPTKFTLGMGQINILLLFLISLSFYYQQKKRQYLSGLVLATAISIKLSPVVLLLFFIRKKQWKIIVSCIITTFLLNAVGTVLLGKDAAIGYWYDVFPGFVAAGGSAYYYNQALTAWLSRAFVTGQIAKVINYFIFGGLLLISLRTTKTKKEKPIVEMGEYGLFILATLIGGGIAWQHHFVTTIIPLLAAGFIIHSKKRGRKYFPIALLALSYLLIAANIKNPTTYPGIILSHTLYGAFLLYVLLIFISNRKMFLQKRYLKKNNAY